MSRSKPRVFLGTEEVAGYYSGLYAGMRALDVPVSRFFSVPHKFNYDRGKPTERLLQNIGARYRSIPPEKQTKKPLLRFVPQLETILTKHIIRNNDLFIFGYMTSLDGMLTAGPKLTDLEQIKNAGKTLISVFHGSEVRPSWLNGNFKSEPTDKIVSRARNRLRWLRTIETHSDIIVSHPPMGPLQNKPYAQYLAVGVPISSGQHSARQKKAVKKRPFTIVHAPSNANAKGTEVIKKTIERLRENGYVIDFRLLINVPNSDVKNTLRNADLLVDQVYSDTPMAHLAGEAASVGCPAVVCGYDLKALREHVPDEAWPPSIFGDPSELFSLVKWAIDNDTKRNDIGAAAQAYVSNRWNIRQVAQNFLYMAEEGIPKEWTFDPARQRFWGGYGMTPDQRDAGINRIVEHAGKKALGLPEGVELPLPRKQNGAK